MKKRPLYCIIILFIISIIIVANTNKANAYTFFNNFNITSLTYTPDGGTAVTVNSINSYASTPWINETITGNYHKISAPIFTLNKDANLSKTQRMYLNFEIVAKTSFAGGDIYANTYFSCPRGQDQLRVSSCIIRDSDKTIVGQRIEKDEPAVGEDIDYAIQAEKNYIVEIELYYNSDTPVAVRQLALAGRLLSVSKNTSATTLPIGFYWQINYNTSSAFYYENPNAAAEAIEEQNRKDDQDRSNMNNQQGDIDDSADESTEDMDNATSNITGIVSTFLGNLNNLNSNNCTLPNISAYGFSLGELNLCTFQPPQWVRTVTSAVVSLIVLSMAVHVFRRIMRIAKGIAGSK